MLHTPKTLSYNMQRIKDYMISLRYVRDFLFLCSQYLLVKRRTRTSYKSSTVKST